MRSLTLAAILCLAVVPSAFAKDTGYGQGKFGAGPYGHAQCRDAHGHFMKCAPAAPAGATAKCRDGTLSFSQHHQGTCSHHGGVSVWLR